MPLDPLRVKALYHSVLDLSELADRSAFLDRECGEDRELRQRLDEGMKQRAEKIPPIGKVRLAEVLDRLIELAEATGKPEDAKMWKDEKAKLPGESTPKPASEKK